MTGLLRSTNPFRPKMKNGQEVEDAALGAFVQVMEECGYVPDPLTPDHYVGSGYYHRLSFEINVCTTHDRIGKDCFRVYIFKSSIEASWLNSHIKNWLELEAFFANFAKLMQMLTA